MAARTGKVPEPPDEDMPVFGKTLTLDGSGKRKKRSPNQTLSQAMEGKATDWETVHEMASRMRDPDYSLQMFYEDCIDSFPELRLFFDDENADANSRASSGISAAAEYQRTVGALFAVYWLLRIDLDGSNGFCFGVDDDWKKIEVSDSDIAAAEGKPFSQLSVLEKRSSFERTFDWKLFSELVARAGCAASDHDCKQRIVALLCLTSFHDIMKVKKLTPIVQKAHAPYCGYDAGVRILDHDVALSYVLEHFPELLPSFAGLGKEEQRSVLFTQAKMHFNHGWFVQAEAPPGGMLSRFKEVMNSGAQERDIDLYFLHWVTDLAGAEATPMAGAEKFVLKFPKAVLGSFLWSMSFLRQLKSKSETELVEEYLEARWSKLLDIPIPQDRSAVALMRLVLMAQLEDSRAVVEAYRALDSVDQKCLATELSKTGCSGSQYKRCPIGGGPAFLLYYAPALMQRNKGSVKTMTTAMQILAVVLRASRAVWPQSQEDESKTVSINIATLKSTAIEDLIRDPGGDFRQLWILQKNNNAEGEVILCRAKELNRLMAETVTFRALDFPPPPQAKPDPASPGNAKGGYPGGPAKAVAGGGFSAAEAYATVNKRIIVFADLRTDCDSEVGLVWLLATLDRRQDPTTVELVLTDGHICFQWLQFIFAEKFSLGGDWELADDFKSFQAGKVVVNMYVCNGTNREKSTQAAGVVRKMKSSGFSHSTAGVYAEGDIAGRDLNDMPGGRVNAIVMTAAIPDLDSAFFARFENVKCTFVVGTPGGVNCPLPAWKGTLAALHRAGPVLYLTPQLTREVRFPKSYVTSSEDWTDTMKRSVWDQVLTQMARRPEIPAQAGAWGLLLRLNVANAQTCRDWYNDVLKADVKKAKPTQALNDAVDAYVARSSGDDRAMGSIIDELKAINVNVEGIDAAAAASNPEKKEKIRDLYRKALFENVMSCVLTTHALLIKNVGNLKAVVDEAGFESMQQRCGYADDMKSLADFFGGDDAVQILKSLPLRRLTPAYDVVGMILASLSLERTREIDGGIGMQMQEAVPSFFEELLTKEERALSDHPVLQAGDQDADCIYSAGPFG